MFLDILDCCLSFRFLLPFSLSPRQQICRSGWKPIKWSGVYVCVWLAPPKLWSGWYNVFWWLAYFQPRLPAVGGGGCYSFITREKINMYNFLVLSCTAQYVLDRMILQDLEWVLRTEILCQGHCKCKHRVHSTRQPYATSTLSPKKGLWIWLQIHYQIW